MKKTFKLVMVLILLDVTVGTVIMYFFDIEKFAEQYLGQILLGILGIGIIWTGMRKYRSLRFIDKQDVRIQFLEVE
ncbi:MAG TPA: hypothetical protein EYH42_04470 [Sulfurovum sp.]|nr:hypothetical protein [Sulfurovum sp.]